MVTDVISCTVDTDQEEVARLAARYNFLAIPVVDSGNHLVGIVTIDDVVDVIREEATEDILKMAGVDETAYESPSVLVNVRTRAPWLFATWLAGLAASLLIGVFEDQLTKTVALAAFIPVVLGMGGNVGSQTATIIVRGLGHGACLFRVGGALFVPRNWYWSPPWYTLWNLDWYLYGVCIRRVRDAALTALSFKHLALSRRCLAACAHDWGQHLYEYGNVRVRRCYDTATLQSFKYRSSSCDRTDCDDDGGCIGDADVFSRSCSHFGYVTVSQSKAIVLLPTPRRTTASS